MLGIVFLIVLGWISFAFLRDFMSLVPTRKSDRNLVFLAYVTIPLFIYLAALQQFQPALACAVGAVALLTAIVLRGREHNELVRWTMLSLPREGPKKVFQAECSVGHLPPSPRRASRRMTLNECLRVFFFAVIVRPVAYLFLGLKFTHEERLPVHGPAIIVANHNSHLDGFILMSLFPLHLIGTLRPLAAAECFLKGRWFRWFFSTIIRTIPVHRGMESREPNNALSLAAKALLDGEIVLMFPEGTRGEPEQMGRLRAGVGVLSRAFPSVPVVPCFIYGLGKALPRGKSLFVPFLSEIHVGEALHWNGRLDRFMGALRDRMLTLRRECAFALPVRAEAQSVSVSSAVW